MRSKKAIKNIIASLLFQIITIICGFIVPQLIIKNYGSNVNGLCSSITQFLAYITLLESGFGPVIKAALYKPLAKQDKNEIEKILRTADKFFKRISYFFIVYVILLVFFYPLIIKKQFDFLFSALLIIVISISTFAEYFFGITYRVFLQADQKTYVTTNIQILTTILNTIAIVVLVYCGCNIIIVKLVSSLIFVARPVLQNVYVRKKYHIELSNVKEEVKINQKWDALAQHIAYVIHSNTDVVVLTIFTKITQVSVYSVYMLVISGVRNLISSFSSGMEALFGNILVQANKKILQDRFKIYELFYYTIVTIFCGCTLVLILPFIKVYTRDITDVNYIIPVFSCLLVISEFIYSIRKPYNSLVLSAGHFKQTKIGSFIEAIVNIVVSVVLVKYLGIVGVAIGTLIAMTIRTIELIFYTSKRILNRSSIYAFKHVFISSLQILIIFLVNKLIPYLKITSYLSWALQATFVTIIISVIVILINFLFFRTESHELLHFVKRTLKKGNA